MKQPVRLERNGEIAEIVINNPPVNALSAAVRRGILVTLIEALEDDSVESIVLRAEGRTFPAGADITEFGKPPQEPSLPELCNFIEDASKPVMAFLHGMALGGGLELAMAAHYRVAQPDTQLGLPEVTLGILPGAGGTQRAPRLMGVEAALELMLSGLPISASEAQEQGLIDAIASDDQDEVAKLLTSEKLKPRPTRDQRKHLKTGTEYMAQVALWRSEVAGSMAREKIVDCVEAALLLPFDAGLEMERGAFLDCLDSPTSKGLRHAFFAERRATKFAELKEAKPRPVASVGILGGGLMGAGVATACLDSGIAVTLVESGEAGVDQALERIGVYYQREAAAGRISQSQGTTALNHLTLTLDLAALSGVDMVIECLPEDGTIKQDVLRKLASVLKPGAILASNTSYQDVTKLGQAIGRPSDTVAMHFFAPVARMKLVEIGVTDDSSAEAVATAFTLARSLGKLPVRCAAKPGLIGNTVLTAYREACDRLLLRGASPNQVDTAMRQMGMPLGPYEMLDRSGLNVAHARRMANPGPFALGLLDQMCEAGWLGRKSGRGYYTYDKQGKAGTINQDMMDMLAAERKERGVTVSAVTAAQVRDQVLLAMVNKGAQLVEEGVAGRPSDIDTVMIHGFGYPRSHGGPMHAADQLTLFEVVRRIDQLAQNDPDAWKVCSLLRRMASERQSFASLNTD